MRKKQLFQFGYWFLASFLLAGVYISFVPTFAQAWMLSTMLLPGALLLRAVIPGLLSGFPRNVHHWLYAAVGVLWMEYLGAIAAYWLLFQLDPDHFPKVLINPVFSLFWISALIVGEFGLRRIFFQKEDDVPKLQFTSARKEYIRPVSHLVYIESRDRYTVIHESSGDQWPTSKSITKWQEELPNWVRIHRSFLINPDHILNKSASALNLKLKEGSIELPISRTYKNAFSN
jgi:hypothetical protein